MYRLRYFDPAELYGDDKNNLERALIKSHGNNGHIDWNRHEVRIGYDPSYNANELVCMVVFDKQPTNWYKANMIPNSMYIKMFIMYKDCCDVTGYAYSSDVLMYLLDEARDEGSDSVHLIVSPSYMNFFSVRGFSAVSCTPDGLVMAMNLNCMPIPITPLAF